jgi:hypothetical protein
MGTCQDSNIVEVLTPRKSFLRSESKRTLGGPTDRKTSVESSNLASVSARVALHPYAESLPVSHEFHRDAAAGSDFEILFAGGTA